MPEPAAAAGTIPQLLRTSAARRPEHTFLEQVEDGGTLTYAEVAREVDAAARGLQGLGVGQGDRVVTILPNVLESVISWFACTTIGAVECPIGTAYKGQLLVKLLVNAEARVLIVASTVLPNVLDVLHAVSSIEHVIVVGTSPGAGPTPKPPPPVAFSTWRKLLDRSVDAAPAEAPLLMSDTACMLFTSGTTGGSRGVLCTFAQEYESAVAAPPRLDANEAIYLTSPPNHVGQKLLLYKALVVGCRVALRSSFSSSNFWDDVRRYGCTHTLLLGGATSYLLSRPPARDDSANPLRSVLMIPIHPEVQSFRSRFGVEVHSMFNMTEICPVTSISDEEISDHHSCGRVREGFDWRLVDELDRDVPAGEPGELVLRPHEPWVFAKGYWRDDAKTVEAWRNLWFHTGDVFVEGEGGYLRHLDRKKDVVRRRGENVSSAELESIASSHPSIQECAAIGVPSEHTEEDIKLVVVAREPSFDDADDVLGFLESRVPRFMLPRFIEFVPQLPKTPTLKVRKTELRAGKVRGRLHDLRRRADRALP